MFFVVLSSLHTNSTTHYHSTLITSVFYTHLVAHWVRLFQTCFSFVLPASTSPSLLSHLCLYLLIQHYPTSLPCLIRGHMSPARAPDLALSSFTPFLPPPLGSTPFSFSYLPHLLLQPVPSPWLFST